MGTEPSFEPQVLACRQRRRLSIPAQRLLLGLLALAFIGLFMTVNLHGNVRYILLHRAQILATLLLVAFAGGVATLLFQTVTHNRILTPSVMGLEALFILLQTATLFFVNVQGLSVLGAGGKFAVETLLLGFSWLLFRWLLGGVGINLHRVLLVGLVCGTLFRSLATLMQRLLSPGGIRHFTKPPVRHFHPRVARYLGGGRRDYCYRGGAGLAYAPRAGRHRPRTPYRP